jgi:hypothetical protein
VANARRWVGERLTQTEVAARCKVVRSVISELLARLGPLPVQEVLEPAGDEQPATTELAAPQAAPAARTPEGVAVHTYPGEQAWRRCLPRFLRRLHITDGQTHAVIACMAILASSARQGIPSVG